MSASVDHHGERQQWRMVGSGDPVTRQSRIKTLIASHFFIEIVIYFGEGERLTSKLTYQNQVYEPSLRLLFTGNLLVRLL